MTKIIANGPTTRVPEKINPESNTSGQVVEAAISPSIQVYHPFFINAGLKFADKLFDKKDDYVNNIAFRKALTSYLSSKPGVLDVKWREIIGVLELGPKIFQQLPFDSGTGVAGSLDFGFEATGLLAYRYSWPKTVSRISLDESGYEGNKILFPNTVEKALKMRIGSEAELKGRGKLLGQIGATLNIGPGVANIVRAGVAATLAASKTIAGEYCLSVTALGAKKVRVKITKLHEDEVKLACNLRAGIINLLTPYGLTIDNALKNFLVNATKWQIENLVLNYVSLLASYSRGSKNTDTKVCCYDLDLSNSFAQEAYRRLVCLCPSAVDMLLEQQNNGIQTVRFEENEDKDFNNIDIQAFNSKLLLRELSHIDNAGILVSNDNSRVYYCDRIYAKKFENIIYGSKEIRWEGIEINENNKAPENYYRFYFKQSANMPTQEEVDKVFDMAARLGFRVSGTLQSDLIDVGGFKSFISGEDDTKTKVEIFFKQAGIAKLQEADAVVGAYAFQKANGFMAPREHQPAANNMLENYDELNNSWFSLFYRSTLEEIEYEYEEAYNRNFDQDYSCFVKAKRFGELVNNFNNAKDFNKAKDFFALLGASDFSYQEVIIAMSFIVGRENILIHKLSLSGGEVALESSDEGQLIHPRDKAANLFNRANSKLI